MLIELESVYGDQIIFGQYFDRNDLQKMLEDLLKVISEQDFSSAF